MTKDEINRLVAEKVMGLEIIKIGDIEYFKQTPTFIWCQPAKTFNPSERIDHAWMVVEKFHAARIVKCSDGKYLCEVFQGATNDKSILIMADTAPMAICLAALAVKEGK